MAKSAVFKLPMPPSVNELYRNVRGRGRVATGIHQRWRHQAAQEISAQRVGQPRIPGPYRLVAEFARCRKDLGNLEKAVSDLLVSMRVIDDDSLAQEFILRWASVNGCRVVVTACASGEFSREGQEV